MILSGPVYKPRSGNAPKSAIILLHGLGADGENLIGLAPFMALNFPDTIFISPNAPFQFDMYPVGYQWFSLTDRTPSKVLAGVQKAAPILDQFIDEVLKEYNLTEDKLALIGFSQGTMTGLYAAMRRDKKLAGVVGFSGRLLGEDLIAAEAKSKPEVCLIHGEEDDVVPFDSMAHAEEHLKDHGFKVEAHARPYLPHSIDPEGIEIASKFLSTRLK